MWNVNIIKKWVFEYVVYSWSHNLTIQNNQEKFQLQNTNNLNQFKTTRVVYFKICLHVYIHRYASFNAKSYSDAGIVKNLWLETTREQYDFFTLILV